MISQTYILHLIVPNRTLLTVCTYYVRTVAYKTLTWKKNHVILAALQYKPLYNIGNSEK